MKKHRIQQKTERRISAGLRLALVALLLLVQIALVVGLSVLLQQKMALAYTLLQVLALIVAGRVYTRPGSSSYKIGWILLILVVPAAGLILYWLWNGESSAKRLTLKKVPLPAESPAQAEQCAAAAAMALGNLLGLVCDPVAGLVEVPCIKRNVVGAVNAVSCANMALAGVDYAIPCDEVIDAMGRVGSLLSPDLRETGQGGLANTPAAREWCAAQEEE